MTTLDNWLADRALKITETERRDLGFAPHQILLDEPASAIAAVADLHRPRKYLNDAQWWDLDDTDYTDYTDQGSYAR